MELENGGENGEYETPNKPPCVVCEDISSGNHYGVATCEGCKGFFRRTVNGGAVDLTCPRDGQCVIVRGERTNCQPCRFQKCKAMGMRTDKVMTRQQNQQGPGIGQQNQRGPRTGQQNQRGPRTGQQNQRRARNRHRNGGRAQQTPVATSTSSSSQPPMGLSTTPHQHSSLHPPSLMTLHYSPNGGAGYPPPGWEPGAADQQEPPPPTTPGIPPPTTFPPPTTPAFPPPTTSPIPHFPPPTMSPIHFPLSALSPIPPPTTPDILDSPEQNLGTAIHQALGVVYEPEYYH